MFQLRGNPTLPSLCTCISETEVQARTKVVGGLEQGLIWKVLNNPWIGEEGLIHQVSSGLTQMLWSSERARSERERRRRESSHLSNSPNNLHGYNILGLDTFLSIDTQSVEDILQPTSARTNPNQWTDASQLNNNKEAQLPPLKSIHYQDEVCRCRYCCLRGFRQCLCPI